MDRRRFLLTSLAGALATPRAAEAQQEAGKVARVGVLWPGPSAPPGTRMDSLRQGLRESGYIEGKNLAIDLRHAEGGERPRELAADLKTMRFLLFASSHPSRHTPARPLDLGPIRNPLVTLLASLPDTSREAWQRGTGWQMDL